MTGARTARLAAVLFAVTAVLFAIGVSSETDEHDERAETHEEGAEGDQTHDEGEEETVLDLDIESQGTVGLAILISGLLAAGLWFRPTRPVAAVAAAFGLAFATLDLAEVAHQVDEYRTVLAVLAGAIALGHAVAALAAGRTAIDPTGPLT